MNDTIVSRAVSPTVSPAGPPLPRPSHQPRASLPSLVLPEIMPWLPPLAIYALAPDMLPLATQINIMILFALSLDLLVGYAGIVTLGHAALFGTGAYAAGLLAVHGVGDPLTGALAAMAASALVGLLSGLVILRTKGLALLMLTIALGFLTHEIANRASGITGGADGLQGMEVAPLLGLFPFDFRGQTGFLYSLAVLFAVYWFLKMVVASPLGWSLRGVRENDARMTAIGSPIFVRRLVAYTLAAALAGLAGALQAQTTQFVSLSSLSFELSGNILVMLIVGGTGHLMGAFIGVPLFMMAQDALSKLDPANWYLGQGLLLMGFVFFARGGIIALAGRIAARLRRNQGGRP